MSLFRYKPISISLFSFAIMVMDTFDKAMPKTLTLVKIKKKLEN